MNIPVILYEDDGTLLQGIESQRGAVSVARTTDDLAEAIGFAHTGIARVLLCAIPAADLTASIVFTLAESDVRVAVLASPGDPLPAGVFRVDADLALPDMLQVIEQITLGNIPAEGTQGQPRLAIDPNGYGYDASYGYTVPAESGEPGSTDYNSTQQHQGADPHGYEPHTPNISGQQSEYLPYGQGSGTEVAQSYSENSFDNNPASYEHGRESSANYPAGETSAESVLNEAASIVDGFAVTQDVPQSYSQWQNDPANQYRNTGAGGADSEQGDDIQEFGAIQPVDNLIAPQTSVEWQVYSGSPEPPAPHTEQIYAQHNTAEPQPGISPVPEVSVSRRGTIITVWGTGGAPGRSTLALNLAATASADGLSVCLIDADTYSPSLSPLLGLLDEYSGISQMCHFADRASLTEQNAREALSSVALGKYQIDFLSGITRANRWPELRAKSLATSIDWLATRYDVLIIDVAACIEADEALSYDGPVPLRNGAAITALEKANRIITLGNADIIGVPRLIQAYEQLRDGSYDISPLTRIDLWLSKVRPDASGHGTVAELRRAWERFGPSVGLSGFLPYDRKSLDKAWMRGQTLKECAPKSLLTRAIDELYRGFNISSAYKQAHTAIAAAPNPAPYRAQPQGQPVQPQPGPGQAHPGQPPLQGTPAAQGAGSQAKSHRRLFGGFKKKKEA